MRRSGFTSITARITSSKRVMSPRSTGAPTGSPSNGGALGLMSNPTTSSPRATSRRMSRGPMKPVAPRTRMRLGIGHARGLPGDHPPRIAALGVHGEVAHGEALLLAVALHVHLGHAVDHADVPVDTGLLLAGGDAAVVRLAALEIGDVLRLGLEARGRVDVGQVVGEGEV